MEEKLQVHYLRFQQHVGTVNAAPLMWPCWFLSSASRRAGAQGDREQSGIFVQDFSTPKHCMEYFAKSLPKSKKKKKTATPSEKAVQLGIRACSITPVLPHFNPKQIRVI